MTGDVGASKGVQSHLLPQQTQWWQRWGAVSFWEQSYMGTSCWQGWALHLQSNVGARDRAGLSKATLPPRPGLTCGYSCSGEQSGPTANQAGRMGSLKKHSMKQMQK